MCKGARVVALVAKRARVRDADVDGTIEQLGATVRRNGTIEVL
jgi:hypothetical protein